MGGGAEKRMEGERRGQEEKGEEIKGWEGRSRWLQEIKAHFRKKACP